MALSARAGRVEGYPSTRPGANQADRAALSGRKRLTWLTGLIKSWLHLLGGGEWITGLLS